MEEILIHCLCGEVIEIKLFGEGSIICGNCGRTYFRYFNAFENTYKIIMKEEK